MYKKRNKNRIDGLTIATDSSNMTLTCDYEDNDKKIDVFNYMLLASFFCLIATVIYIAYLFK